MHVTAIITAAGKGLRTGCEKNKLLTERNGKTVLQAAVEKFLIPSVDDIIITAAQQDIEDIKRLFSNADKPVNIVQGGASRTQSVMMGLNGCGCADIVLIHDGARPFVSPSLIERCIQGVINNGSAVAAIPVCDTLKRAEGNVICGDIDRNNAYYIQTPQGFYYSDILKAYKCIKEGEVFTDDSSVYARYIGPPCIVEGDRDNIKITYPQDLEYFYREQMIMKCGTGYDCHKIVKGRKFILGGVNIPFEAGLEGHSDADALAHAICDSLLSAAGLPDIGHYFPDTDDAFKDANSMDLLKKCRDLVNSKGYKICNISAVINCERPRIADYIAEMKKNIASCLGIQACDVGISAKTNEGMGFSGKGEGLFVIANCVIR